MKFMENVRLGQSAHGFSIVEAVVAMAIGTLAVGGAMLLNSHQLRMVKSARESNAAVHTIAERVEQLRDANWKQITDPVFISSTFFAKVPRSAAPLDSYSEKLTISAWPDPTACNKLVVEKAERSPANVLLSGAGLSSTGLARVDVQITWSGKDRRERTREMSTVISNGGISRMHLPVWNTAGWESFSTPTPATPAPTGGATPVPTISTGATPSPGSPAPTQSGRGRGTISRPNGKK